MSDSDNTKDTLLTLYANVAQKFIENKTGRTLYATNNDLPTAAGWHVSLESSPDLKLALLLLVTHFHENPSATSDETVKTVPYSFYALISPYIVADPTILPE